ncbi:hypothetical protein LTR97_012711 [Elasticomyces elasticus]|uniref:F-box domain-containing protein n=1 Tax=Elasticomyces elasticus TaxID=574655 RepID=A0AAN7VX83_9PEZI|nr:hypothetical protein LTR97_012711 [Elasticomyces elasticus]
MVYKDCLRHEDDASAYAGARGDCIAERICIIADRIQRKEIFGARNPSIHLAMKDALALPELLEDAEITEDISRPQPERCRLLELPAELRLLIFEMVYDDTYLCEVLIDDDQVFRYRTENLTSLVTRMPSDLLALPLACKTMSAETIPVLYEATEFHVNIRSSKKISYGYARSDTGCSFLGGITKLHHLSLTSPGFGNERVTRRVYTLIGLLPAGRDIELQRLSLDLATTGSATATFKALMRLRCKSGAHVTITSDRCATPEVWEAFKKTMALIE